MSLNGPKDLTNQWTDMVYLYIEASSNLNVLGNATSTLPREIAPRKNWPAKKKINLKLKWKRKGQRTPPSLKAHRCL